MPFTAFHWGFPYVLGEFLFSDDLRKRRFQIVGLLGATLSDLEGFLNLIGFEQIEIHGPLHSIFGAIILGLLLLLSTHFLYLRYKDEYVTEDDFVSRYFKWKINLAEKFYIITSPLIFQVFIDLWCYSDMELFWPFITDSNSPGTSAGKVMMENIGSFLLLISIFLIIYNFITTMIKYSNVGGFEPQ